MGMPGFRKQKPGKFGTQYITMQTGQIGGSNMLGSTTPLTANTTTTFRLGGPPVKCRLVKLSASCVTVGADADGTILARAMKYASVGDAASAVSADIDLEALVTREITAVGPLSTASDATRLFNGTGDTLEINVVSNSAAIDTQPAGLVFTALFEVLE